MALSPFYNWSEPDNSSLVKNGAADIRTLGDAIDTSVWNVGYGQAGKNKIINGDFAINQRGFTSTTTSGTYMFDRWLPTFVGGGATCSSQVATVGTNLGSKEVTNYLRTVTTGQSGASVATFPQQKIEDVRTFAGQTVTVSFYAKAATGTPKIAVEFSQFFNSSLGGSATVQTYAGQVTLTTAWARYNVTVTIPSISGKTIATGNCLVLNLWVSAGSDFDSRTGTLGIQSNTFDIWGVQVEAGSFATPFQTASGGSPQAELAMCQRYYQVIGSGAAGGADLADRVAVGSSFLVSMRSAPTLALVGQVSVRQRNAITTAASPTVATYYRSTTGYAAILDGFAGLTAGSGLVVAGDTGSNGNNTFTLSAEL